jgi:Leucine-rich repeat (LRR) protein
MTTEQIIKGVWYWDRPTEWPPEAITFFENYDSKEKLNLNITQLNTSPGEQKKIVKKWCDELPKLTTVKYLWFCSRVNQEMFEAACEMKNLKGLYIKWSGIKNIDSLKKLKQLDHLHIGSSGQIEDIKVFNDINWLTTLNLEQLNKITDFTDINGMTNLQGLGIDGSIWTTQKIETLKPLENLTNLKYLTLTNTRILDKSFDPILKLKDLVRFNSSWNYPESEFDKLKVLPNLKYGNIETSWKEIKDKMKIK